MFGWLTAASSPNRRRLRPFNDHFTPGRRTRRDGRAPIVNGSRSGLVARVNHAFSFDREPTPRPDKVSSSSVVIYRPPPTRNDCHAIFSSLKLPTVSLPPPTRTAFGFQTNSNKLSHFIRNYLDSRIIRCRIDKVR